MAMKQPLLGDEVKLGARQQCKDESVKKKEEEEKGDTVGRENRSKSTESRSRTQQQKQIWSYKKSTKVGLVGIEGPVGQLFPALVGCCSHCLHAV